MRHSSWHLRESELEAVLDVCVFCGGAHFRHVALVQQNPDISFRLCTRCLAASASRLPKEDVLDRYYRGSYEGLPSHKEAMSRIASPENRCRIGRHILNLVPELSRRGGSFSILDFGASDGAIALGIAQTLLDSGVEKVRVALVDYERCPASVLPRPGISIEWFDSLDKVKSVFDLVIASAVIEHVRYPENDIRTLLRSLSPGGTFYCRAPWMLPVHRLLSTFFIRQDLLYPAHLHDLGAHFWNGYFNEICEQHGCKVILSRPSIVETLYKEHFFRTLFASLMKMPSMISRKYPLVGGWEVAVRKPLS